MLIQWAPRPDLMMLKGRWTISSCGEGVPSGLHREYQENPYVFKWPDGHPYSPDYISHRFNKLLKKH